MKKTALLIAAVLCAVAATSQTAVGRWRDCIDLTASFHVAVGGDQVALSSKGNLWINGAALKDYTGGGMDADEKDEWIKQLEDQMLTAASELDFEKAAKLRDQLFALRGDTPIDKHQPSRRRRERMRKAEH